MKLDTAENEIEVVGVVKMSKCEWWRSFFTSKVRKSTTQRKKVLSGEGEEQF